MTNKLLAGVEKELSAQPRPRRFSADIEERFEADTAPKRQRQLITGGLVALLIYDLFIFNDYALRPEDLGSAAVLRFGVMTPVGLLILWAVHLGQQPAIREGLMAATIAVAMLVSCLIFMMSMSNNALFDPFSFGLIL